MNNHFLTLNFIAIILMWSGCRYNTSESDTNLSKLSEFTIAYNVLVNDSTDNYEVFTMNMDGTEKRNVTNLSGVEWTYYSHQDKLCFISDKDTCQRCAYYLYETNYLGRHPKKFSQIPLADSWMSSRRGGSEFIIKPNSKLDSAFYIIDIKGMMIQRIETGLPSFSDPLSINDGGQVVFRGGSKKSKREPGYQEELYKIDVDGSGLTQLTHYPPSDTTAAWYAYKAGAPKQHPTENFISYQSFQDGKYSLYAVTIDGNKQWKLTENQEEEGWHDWSPDGKWLAVELFDDHQTQFHIGLMNWKTKEVKILTDTSYKYQQAPNFLIKNL